VPSPQSSVPLDLSAATDSTSHAASVSLVRLRSQLSEGWTHATFDGNTFMNGSRTEGKYTHSAGFAVRRC
jgi:hypothetical protein